jgi:hypothetical protein
MWSRALKAGRHPGLGYKFLQAYRIIISNHRKQLRIYKNQFARIIKIFTVFYNLSVKGEIFIFFSKGERYP